MSCILEQLEGRQLMAAGVLQPVDSTLSDVNLRAVYYPVTVQGAPSTNNNISISRDGMGNLIVNVNGQLSKYPEWQVTKFVVYGGQRDDTISAYSINTPLEVYCGDGTDTVYGSQVADVISGGGRRDYLYGYGGDDIINAGDYLGNTGGDYVNSGDGNDTIYASANNNTIYAGAGDDTVYANQGNDYISTADGNDVVYAGSGDDTVYAGNGDDWVSGQDGNDLLRGEAGADVLYAGSGDDTVYGGADNDSVNGEFGDDTLYGEGGADVLCGDAGCDNLYGGADADCLDGGAGDDGLFGGSEIDALTGGGDDDRFLDRTWEVPVSLWTERRWEDTVTDLEPGDARLGFQNAPQQTVSFSGQPGSYTFAAGTWTDGEVQTLDSALEVLHEATGNTRLLKKSNRDGLDFFRAGPQIASTGGTFSADAWTTNGNINVAQVDRGLLLREIGHNWDEEYDAANWQAQSGWRYQPPWNTLGAPSGYTKALDSSSGWYYASSASFVNTNARINPNQDFAETFQVFFTNRAGWSNTAIPAGKYAFMQNMVNGLT